LAIGFIKRFKKNDFFNLTTLLMPKGDIAREQIDSIRKKVNLDKNFIIDIVNNEKKEI